MSNPDFPSPPFGVMVTLVTIMGFMFLVFVAGAGTLGLGEIIIAAVSIVLSVAMCICLIGGAVLIVRKLKESK